jgi:hypothetical protein
MKLDSQNATENELIVCYQSLLKCNGLDFVSIAVGMNDWALSLGMSESCDSKSLIELLGEQSTSNLLLKSLLFYMKNFGFLSERREAQMLSQPTKIHLENSGRVILIYHN